MAKYRRLRKAPITEAVIDVRCSRESESDVESLRPILPEITENYLEPEDLSVMEWGIRHEPGKRPTGTQIDRGKIGFRFASKDGKHVAQFRKDGFTFSRLEPYPDWATVFAQASHIFKLYATMAQIAEVTRVAVRYINRMMLPLDRITDFSEFLTAPPPFPEEIDALMSHFLTEVRVHEPDGNIQAIVRQTIQRGSRTKEFVPVILDIDVFEMGNFDINPDAVLARFEPLRQMKNRIFFASITEDAADLFA